MTERNSATTSTFPNLKWAHKYLTSPGWRSTKLTRSSSPASTAGAFCKLISREGGIRQWFELQPTSPVGQDKEWQSISVVDFGEALTGFPGYTHGGAAATILDEAMGFAMILFTSERAASGVGNIFVTSTMSVSFLRPLKCPGSCGVIARIVEAGDAGVRLSAVLMDEEGREAATAESRWKQIGKPKERSSRL